MKCVAIKDKKLLEIKEIEEPHANGNDVIIEVSKCGICGSDLHYFEMGLPKGLVMGHEYSGVVLDKGSRDDLEIGNRVTALPISPCMKCEACVNGNINYCLQTWNEATGLALTNPGGLTKKIKIRPDMVIKLDDKITDEEAAMVEPSAVSLHAINLADIKIGDKVLIIGGGIIGLGSAMFAKLAGASHITLFETNEQRGNKALKLGVVDEFINVSNEDTMNEFMQKKQASFDKVIECCGNSKAVTSSLIFAKVGATVVLVGVSMDQITIPSAIALMHELTIKGAIAYTKQDFERCIELISNKQIDVLKFLDKQITLEETQEAYDELINGKTDTIKIIVDLKK